jgi:predicted transcriptional regulator
MTMGDLAEALGITISYVSDLIKEKRTNKEQLQRIKNFLNLSDAGEDV